MGVSISVYEKYANQCLSIYTVFILTSLDLDLCEAEGAEDGAVELDDEEGADHPRLVPNGVVPPHHPRLVVHPEECGS